MIKPKKLADGRWECQNCLKKFTRYPRDKEHKGGYVPGKEPKFCSDRCRKEFHRGGGMSFRKLRHQVERWVDARLAVWAAEFENKIAAKADRVEIRPGAFVKEKKI